MRRRQYKIKPNDSWISIANDWNISLDDLLFYNGIDPTSRQSLPVLHPGQKVYVRDPYVLKAAKIEADAPKDYGDWGIKGQQKIDAYAQAFKQRDIDWKDIPSIYQIPVMQRYITMGTDAVAKPFNYAMDAAAMLINPAGYFIGKGAQKASAYGYDFLSGKNEYGWDDIGKHTPILGRENASESPFLSALIDTAVPMATTSVIMAGSKPQETQPFLTKNIVSEPTVMTNDVKSTIEWLTGLKRDHLSNLPIKHDNVIPIKPGGVYQSGIKGYGKTGNTYGSPNIGYIPKGSLKGTFNHSYSGSRSSQSPVSFEDLSTPIPVTPPFMWNYKGIGMPLLHFPTQNEISVNVVPAPEKHIYEQQSFNRWQMPNPDPEGIVVPFKPGTGRFTITGNAPISTTVDGQALTNESLNTWYDYMPRKAVYVPGPIQGTPSNIKSGLGITYGSDNPESLIIE